MDKIRLNLNDDDYLKIMIIDNQCKFVMQIEEQKLSKIVNKQIFDDLVDIFKSYIDTKDMFNTVEYTPVLSFFKNEANGLLINDNKVTNIKSIKIDDVKNNLHDVTVKFRGLERE